MAGPYTYFLYFDGLFIERKLMSLQATVRRYKQFDSH